MAEFTTLEDSIQNDKERDSFIRDLQEFHEKRGTPFREGPKISGRWVDLHQLYNLVTSEGGWVKVNSRNDWDKIIEDLKLPADCVNSTVAVKQIYLRYLDRYEELHYFGEIDERGMGDDEDDSRNRKLTMRSLNTFPHYYNHVQHSINDALRDCNGLSIDLYKPSEYDKLALSLLSPLANEQDFAINVCTLISHESKHCLKLQRHPRILHYLLAHAAVFNHTGLRQVISEHYSQGRNNAMSKFWHDIVCDSRLTRLIDENKFQENQYEDDFPDELVLTQKEKEKDGLNFEPEDSEIFCIGRTLGTQEYLGQRVLQVASILRNLTFIQENINIMSKDLTFLRFVLLCCGSNWNTLHQMGWDMLGNIAQEITVLCPLMPEVLDLTVEGLDSTDRAQILSSLEVMNRLGLNSKNEDYFLKYLKGKVYNRICSFLSIQDIMLLIYTLECLYSISSMGEKACDAILRVHGVLDTLVSLVTVEAQSYGPKACIQMKVVETVTGVAGSSVTNGNTTGVPPTTPNTSVTTTPQSVAVSTPTSQISTLATQALRPQLVLSQGQVVQATSPQVGQTHVVMQSPSKVVQTQMSPATPTSSKVVQVVQTTPQQVQVSQSQVIHLTQTLNKVVQAQQVSSQNIQTVQVTPSQFQLAQSQGQIQVVQTSQAQTTIQSQAQTNQVVQTQSRITLAPSPTSISSPQQVVQENERFVLLWLRNTFEPNIGSRIEQQELYKKYIDYCVKIGRRGVIAPLHFPRYVRSVFGSNVGPVTCSAGELSQQYFDGIRLRAEPGALPTPLTQVNQTMSPLLKAQLSAPLKPTSQQQPTKIIQRQIILQQGQDGRCIVTSSPSQVSAIAQTIQASLSQPASPVSTPQSPASTTSVINSVIAHSMSPPPTSAGVSVIEKLPMNANPQSQTTSGVKEPEKINGSQLLNNTKLILKKEEEMETEVTSTSGETTNRSLTPVSTSTSCIKVTPSLLDHEYTGNTVPTLIPVAPPPDIKTEMKIEPPSNENSNDSILMNGLSSKASDTDDSNSKDSAPKKLMLADLLEKNIDKTEPSLTNCSLRIGEKGLELVPGPEREKTGVIESNGPIIIKQEPISNLKRPGDEIAQSEVKKPKINGNSPPKEEPPEEGNVSSSAANLYAALAADALEDEPMEETPKPPVIVTAVQQHQQVAQQNIQQHQPRQILLTTSGSQIAQSVIVGGQHYIVTQPQTTLVQGQAQTVLVAQTQQQGLGGAKTIIFLQPQNVSGGNSQQKVLVQTGNPPPLIATSQASTVLRPKGTSSTAQTSLLQQAIMRQNLTKTIQVQGNIQSPQKQTVLQQQGGQTIVVQQGVQQQGGQTVVVQQGVQQQGGQTVVVQQGVQQQGGQTVLVQQGVQQQGGKTVVLQQGVQQQPSVVQTATIHHQPTVVQSTGQQTVLLQQPVASKSEVKVSSSGTIVVTSATTSVAVAATSTTSSLSPTVVATAQQSTPQSPTSSINIQVKQQLDKGKFLCEWRGCMRSFKTASEVYIHACEAHCPETPKDIQCLWQRCDTMKRKRFSHMTHLYNRHCNPEVMRVASERSRQLLAAGKQLQQEVVPQPVQTMPHPGYAPNAAMLAINRHASDYVNPKELQDENEGPVTKSIRLTSALILRNLIIYSTNGRKHMSRFEPHLANVALSGVESSRTIAHVLFDMCENRWHSPSFLD